MLVCVSFFFHKYFLTMNLQNHWGFLNLGCSDCGTARYKYYGSRPTLNSINEVSEDPEFLKCSS